MIEGSYFEPLLEITKILHMLKMTSGEIIVM